MAHMTNVVDNMIVCLHIYRDAPGLQSMEHEAGSPGMNFKREGIDTYVIAMVRYLLYLFVRAGRKLVLDVPASIR